MNPKVTYASKNLSLEKKIIKKKIVKPWTEKCIDTNAYPKQVSKSQGTWNTTNSGF